MRQECAALWSAAGLRSALRPLATALFTAGSACHTAR